MFGGTANNKGGIILISSVTGAPLPTANIPLE
jgi:hypothetical protein